jgi:hypothetical protein
MKLLTFALIALTLTACSKYEEGSGSLSSKKARLVNDWKTVQITSNGYDITSLKLITEVSIRNDNSITVTNEVFGFPISSTGKWIFDAKKENVLVTNSDESLDSYTIVMLEKDECKFRRTDFDGNLLTYHFVSK